MHITVGTLVTAVVFGLFGLMLYGDHASDAALACFAKGGTQYDSIGGTCHQIRKIP